MSISSNERVQIPKHQPFLKDWLTANEIDTSLITNEVYLTVGKIIDRNGIFKRFEVIIVAERYRFLPEGDVLLLNGTHATGKTYFVLKEWPVGVQHVVEWDALLDTQDI